VAPEKAVIASGVFCTDTSPRRVAETTISVTMSSAGAVWACAWAPSRVATLAEASRRP
jgi:hypothetical protein